MRVIVQNKVERFLWLTVYVIVMRSSVLCAERDTRQQHGPL